MIHLNKPLYLADKDRKDIFIYPLLVFFSFVFLAVYAFATSPFYGGYVADSATFIMLGKMLLAGKIPYVDFFDHKGPMVIFTEALGQTFSSNDRLGIFILQVICLSLSQIFIYKTARCFLSPINSISIALGCLVFLRFTIEGGNLTEEYSLPFTALSLWLTVRYYLSPSNKVDKLHLFLMGVSGALLFWARLNNMGIVVACTLFMFIVSLLNKDYKAVKQIIVWFMAGFLLISALIIIYFVAVGAFNQMIDAAFLFNLRYIHTESKESPFSSFISAFLYILKGWTPFITLTIGTALVYFKHRNYQVLLLSGLLLFIGYITTHIGAAYYHYMTLNMPVLALGAIFCLYIITRNSEKRKLSVFIFVLLLIPVMAATAYTAKDMNPHDDAYYIGQAQDAAAQVPQNERNSVYAYQVMTRFYPSAQLLPCYRYFTMQEWHGKHNPAVLDSINAMMEQRPPLWVISQFRDMSNNPRFYEIVADKYYLHHKNDLFEVFRLKPSPQK